MTDHFAILTQARRPWVGEAALKEAFHRATAQHHPDLAGGSSERAAALNAAYSVLRDPASRLRHLLELEAPEALRIRPVIGPEMTDVFGKIAALRQACAGWEKKNALARALATAEREAIRSGIEAMLGELHEIEVAALGELRDLDGRWEQRDPLAAALLAARQQDFAFLAKWQAQLREDLFRLSS